MACGADDRHRDRAPRHQTTSEPDRIALHDWIQYAGLDPITPVLSDKMESGSINASQVCPSAPSTNCHAAAVYPYLLDNRPSQDPGTPSDASNCLLPPLEVYALFRLAARVVATIGSRWVGRDGDSAMTRRYETQR